MKKYFLGCVFTLALLGLSATTAHANFIFAVSVDTSGLSSNYTAPFGIDLQLISGLNASGNTAALSDFNFGSGGSASGSPSSMGGNVSGSLSSTAHLFELCDDLFLVYIGESGGEAVSRCAQFGHVGGFDGFARSRNVDS